MDKYIYLLFEHLKVFMFIIFLLVVITSYIIALSLLKSSLPNDTTIEFESSSESELFVDISGAVNKPGVYEIKQNYRIKDLINLAGGFTNDVSKLWVAKNLNLSKLVTDSDKIYVPFEFELADPSLYSIEFEFANSTENSDSDQVDSDNKNDADSDLINVNTASSDELQELSGVGEVNAQKIIDNRTYDSLEDFKSKSTLSETLISKISDSITF